MILSLVGDDVAQEGASSEIRIDRRCTVAELKVAIVEVRHQ